MVLILSTVVDKAVFIAVHFSEIAVFTLSTVVESDVLIALHFSDIAVLILSTVVETDVFIVVHFSDMPDLIASTVLESEVLIASHFSETPVLMLSIVVETEVFISFHFSERKLFCLFVSVCIVSVVSAKAASAPNPITSRTQLIDPQIPFQTVFINVQRPLRIAITVSDITWNTPTTKSFIPVPILEHVSLMPSQHCSQLVPK